MIIDFRKSMKLYKIIKYRNRVHLSDPSDVGRYSSMFNFIYYYYTYLGWSLKIKSRGGGVFLTLSPYKMGVTFEEIKGKRAQTKHNRKHLVSV